MNISLNNSEIEEALVHYIRSQGIDLADKAIGVTLVAGRGANGHSANIAIDPADSSSGTESSEAEEPANSEEINFS